MENKYFLTLCCALALGFSAESQLLNPGFENWTAGDPDNWQTSNSVDVGLVTVSETSDSHSGPKAAHLEIISFFGNSVPPFLQSGPEGIGFAVSQNPTGLNLFYKFSPVSGDRFSVNIACYNNGNAIGSGAVALGTTVNAYSPLTVPITYFAPGTADTIIIQFGIVGTTNFSDYHVGSEAFVDDVSFENGTTSLAEISAENPKAYPNPVSQTLHIPLPGFTGGKLLTYDASGKKITENSLHEGTDGILLDVSAFAPGVYIYELHNGSSVFREKFRVEP